MILLASIFFMKAMPLDMPRAEAYLVTEPSGKMRLEDRYDALDLWTSHTVLGRWVDNDGRVFTLSRISELVPKSGASTITREKYYSGVVVPDRKNKTTRNDAIKMLSPFDLPEEPTRPHIPVPAMRDVFYYHGTNTTSVVAAFCPEENPYWYLAVWDLIPGDDFSVAVEKIEREFLSSWGKIVKKHLPSEQCEFAQKPQKKRADVLSERELLRRDAIHSITNYSSWRCTAQSEFTVIDDIAGDSSTIDEVVEELSVMRSRYASIVPTPLEGTNVLAIVRLYKNRDEYLSALNINDIENMQWSAAYWSAQRRELVAYLPEGDKEGLLTTIRHEAFHQYLSYALSMIPSSPWFNEGYAQYFEDESSSDWKMEVDIESLAQVLPAIMAMDYEQFYSGTDEVRRLKYRVAWSMAYFLEKGACKVLREPFKNVKKDYVDSLLKTKDMRKATAAAFKSEDVVKRFVKEWKKFWLAM